MNAPDRLARILERLPPDDAEWLAARAARLVKRPDPAIERRNVLLREVAEKHFGGTSENERARAICEGLTRYAASAWPRERLVTECPERHHGRVSEYWWRILKQRDFVPSQRQIRRVLAIVGMANANAHGSR